MASGWRVSAIDASPRMLDVARINVKHHGLGRRIRLRHGDAKALAGLRKKFDLVFSNSLLHHLLDPTPFWGEIRRLVKPGGAVLIQDLLRPESKTEARRLVRRHAGKDSPLLRRLFYQSLLAAFTTAEVRTQIRENGLEGLRVRKVSDRHLIVHGQL